jgi:WD40 repeat protein
MKKHNSNPLFSNSIGVLVVLIIAAVALLTWRWMSNRPQGVAPLAAAETAVSPPQSTPIGQPSAYPGPGDPTPTPPIPTIPPCSIEDGKLPNDGSATESGYVFSEPRVVMTSTSGIAIAQWLPDNERLLVSRVLWTPEKSERSIELVNAATGESVVYGTVADIGPFATSGLPVWIDSVQSVAAPDWNADRTSTVLRVLSSSSTNIEQAVPEIASVYIGSDPISGRIIYFSKANPNEAQSFDPVGGVSAAMPLPQPVPAEKGYMPNDYFANFQVAFSPDGSRFVQYNNQAFYMAEPNNGKMCELEFGSQQRAFMAKWSPDGRFLALNEVFPRDPIFRESTVAIVDFQNSRRYTLVSGNFFVYDLAWSPDSESLAVVITGEPVMDGELPNPEKLIIANVFTGETKPLTEGFFISAWGLAWSSRSNQIAFQCALRDKTSPLITEGRLCIIAVGKNQ